MSKIINIKNLTSIRKKLVQKKVVMCHGVFDLLHLGHIIHFEEAKKMGDILIASVTSDKYVKKGYGRPHFNISERIKSLTALSFIDYVIESDFPTAELNIKKIKPDIYCKGSEYSKSSKDVTKNIIKEKKLIKKINAEIRYTSGKIFSSSTLINKYSQVFDEKQKSYLNKIKKKYSFTDIEFYLNKISKLNLNVLGEIITDKYTYCEAVGTSGKDPFLVFEKKKTNNFKEEVWL
ncbi:adenylyltransferase/cytidyltransferase family protein [Candidatus Pelagibacter bacterium nBUS_32]|uniref:adenylyltransferase/cytidyltransferase family protein n=1 Tax=Candidatus Pelagibacter bacterium nBUS_32 TaxID=3374192 RepID=UPI003EBF3849